MLSRCLRCVGSSRGVAIDVRVHPVTSILLQSLILFYISSRRRTMPRIHQILFWVSVVMFLVSVAHLGLVVQQITVEELLPANVRTQLVLSGIQVRCNPPSKNVVRLKKF